jgi:predicted CXXCH cytochrome family protein
MIVDHTQVLGACGSCHDGVTATGKHPTHIASGNNCDDCHSTVAWLPANFDHINITGNCVSCHNGTDATGKNPTHPQTTNVCEDCHTTNVFAPVLTVDHAQVLGSCSSCHNGVIATGTNAGHFSTPKQCDTCHITNAWTPADYRHTTLAYEPLDHRDNFNCTECHTTNAETVNYRSPGYRPNCAGCHANDYKAGVDKHNGLSRDQNCASSGCHRISDREW